MNELNTLLTSEDYREYAEFWTRSFGLIEEDFRLRQNWQPTALSSDEEILALDLKLDERVADVVIELGRGKDAGVFVGILAALFHVMRIYAGAATVFADSPRLSNGGDDHGLRVPLILGYDGSLTVRAYLDRVRDLVAAGYTYQDFPISEFVEGPLQRSLPTTNVLVQLPGFHEPIAAPEAIATYDLIVTILRDDRDLSIRLEGRATILSAQFLENFGRHLRNAIAGFINLDVAIGTMSVIDEDERHKLLQSLAWTRGEAPEGTVLDLFHERAAQAPESIAIVAGEIEITYRELDDKSNRIAQYLISEHGVQRGDVIGVLAVRSELWVMALLGILKAGGVYLPLDPEYPEDRIWFMVEDAAVKALLIHSDCLPMVTDLEATPIFALDLQLDMLDPAPEFSHRASPADSAYIIYTSGSTGQPKGVVIGHAGLVNMVVHHVESFGFDKTDRLTQFYSPSFDGSILEVLVAFLCGGTLVIAPGEIIKDPQQFSSYIANQRVTTVNAAPMYLDTLDWEGLPDVRRVISAGDQARVETARRLAQCRAFNNSYGPTEATVCATNYQIDLATPCGNRIPVGRPLRNMAIYLLDDNLNLVPQGVVGEICISGVGLAKGYLNRDDLTGKAFVANPFVSNERLYRTGDLGVWRPDGNLELTGRRDTQVKVRGFRIELGEVEAHLLQIGGVKEAVVVVREEQPGDKRLIAFVSPAETLSSEDLREQLKSTLPAYMVPSSFVLLDQMPVNHNGKIDRTALASVSIEPADPLTGYAQPENAIQEILMRIWSEVLGRKAIGIHDNFFELGGDSILAIQAVSNAHQAGLKMSGQQLFEYPTIAALSNVSVIAQSLRSEQQPSDGPFPLTPIQRWFLERPLKNRHHYNQSVMLEVPAFIAPEVFDQAYDLLIQHHDALRLRFLKSDGIWEQMYAETETNSLFEVTDLSGLTSLAQDDAIKAEAARLQGSLNLSSGPLLRAHLFKRGGSLPSRLLLIIHHLAVDGVSWRILFEDFYAACVSLQAGAPVQFPARTSSYLDWAIRLQRLSDTEIANQDYWIYPARWEAPQIPIDYETDRARNTVESQAVVTVALSPQATSNLLEEAPRAFNTQINDILLTALLLTFQEWAGESRLLVDLEGHGREDLFDDVDVSRTTGWFTTVHPLLLESEPGAFLADTLKSVKEQIRAVPLRGIGYGIARYLSADRDYVAKLESQPQADVVFNYLGQVDRVAVGDADWKPLLDWKSTDHAPNDPRSHALEIEGMVHGGCLRLTWKYSHNLHAPATIERISNRYTEHLQLLIDHCSSVEAGSFTPSDFPAARLDQDTLDTLIARIRG